MVAPPALAWASGSKCYRNNTGISTTRMFPKESTGQHTGRPRSRRFCRCSRRLGAACPRFMAANEHMTLMLI